ncbi:MAG: hypothetical protein AVDCRST_MAG25-3109, partial [uncultured Rubrobacteraceae bacterium]
DRRGTRLQDSLRRRPRRLPHRAYRAWQHEGRRHNPV